ncbi:MAG: indolepyruvate oxidoreductase subunit beta [Oscillospiraceae bacterium]|nr:indolepyruvate oxidoreductase subunit beta [Oscillospiraceae bacterium]
MNKNILIVGVGGQGTLLASKIMGKCFLDQGYDVKVGEVHGMSQRGGSVVTYVRYGDKVWSPVIEKGEADIIISFEQLESARWLPYLKPGGVIISNTQKIDPMPVIMGKAEYPDDVLGKISALGVQVEAVPADELAVQAGSLKAANVVLLGAAAHHTGIEEKLWIEAVKTTVPPKTVEVNLRAFELGYNCNK